MNEHAYDVEGNASIAGRYLGIDPGKNGGLAIVGSDGSAIATRMPATERDIYDWLNDRPRPSHAVLEKVHSTPQMGVKSAFTFGRGYGSLVMVLTAWGIPFTEVTPAKWQRHLGCLTKGDKNVTKARAQQLYPELPITHATADALLIARYCMESCV
jgi:Holliday junction resolvasome RuvABC endonuclease subunit